ncbi:discoidin domain-containing protein [Myxococcus sp. MISCRS1]|uniref:PKD domain-containing protein n=1 Tax=Myxococcus sp. MISCRS1 TaxID=2996786 RepID=UPI002270E222|nr:discoidin domain-containing protein [Myxococcus sp. MISCRS1]MCY1001054.1 discoidin domain-containing protein [Myxococcus sp. MISCRS1]
MRWHPPSLLAAVLSLVALPAWAQTTNVALNKPSTASSIHPNGYPTQFANAKAFNGILNTEDRWAGASVPSATTPEWIEVDLQAVHRIEGITLYSGRDNTVGQQMLDFDFHHRLATTAGFEPVPGGAVINNTQPTWTLALAQPLETRYVRLSCKRASSDGLCRVRELELRGARLANQPPTAFAGNDTAIVQPASSVQLQGTASDTDGTIATYQWQQAFGPTPATLTGATTRTVTASNLTPGSYIFRFTATDNGGAAVSDTVSVKVHAGTQAADARAGKIHVWSRGGTYDTAVFLPIEYGADPLKKYPLVLSLHGRGGTTLSSDHTTVLSNPEGFIRQLIPGKAIVTTYPAVVIAPHAPRIGATPPYDTYWNVDLTHALVLEAITRFNIDPDRVTMTGLSFGGAGVNDQLLKYRSTYAGGMPLAYTSPVANPLCSIADFPLWAAGNSGDGTFNAWKWTNPTDGVLTQLRQCPNYTGEIQVTVTPGTTHSGWDEFWSRPDAQTWLVSQVR